MLGIKAKSPHLKPGHVLASVMRTSDETCNPPFKEEFLQRAAGHLLTGVEPVTLGCGPNPEAEMSSPGVFVGDPQLKAALLLAFYCLY